MYCSLCRSGRQGTKTLRKAQRRQVEWPQRNVGLFNPVPVSPNLKITVQHYPIEMNQSELHVVSMI